MWPSFAWGLCLYRAARAPRHNLGLVDFTSLQGLLHGCVMAGDLVQGHAGHGGAWHLLGDIPLRLSAPLVLGFLPSGGTLLGRSHALGGAGVFGGVRGLFGGSTLWTSVSCTYLASVHPKIISLPRTTCRVIRVFRVIRVAVSLT